MEQEFRRLKQELDSGNITWQQYQRQTRQVNQGPTAVRNEAQQTRRMFDAIHPSVSSLGRVMSGFGSISHPIITVQNALNLATIANSETNSQLAESQAAVNEAQREYT